MTTKRFFNVMANKQSLNELALFAGAGGGILGGKLLGWRTVCAVEWEQYPASVLCARQNDGLLPPFPIWDDIQTFDGKPWRGIVDVVSGGFPCQDISAAGGGLELTAQNQECGNTWRGWLAKYDQDSCSWKTAQCSLITDSDESLETYPRSGMTVDGLLWEQTRSERNTRETEYGLLPTPTARDFNGHTITRKRPKGFNKVLPNVFKLEFQLQGQCYPHPTFSEGLMLWPIGWTDLKPLEMDKYHFVQQQHGES